MADDDIQVPADLPVTGSSGPSEPLAQPDQSAPSTGTEQESASEQVPAAPEKEEPTGEGKEGEQQPEKEKRVPWFVPRLERYRGENAELRQRLQEMEARLSAPQSGQQPDPNLPSNPQDIARLADQIAEQKVQVRVFNDACNRVAAQGDKEFADFREATGVLNMMGAMRPEILNPLFETSEDIAIPAHKLLYELGKHPDEAAQILSLPPHRMGAALARFADKASAKKPPPPVSTAPKPVRHIAGASNVDLDDSKLSDAAWAKKYPNGKGATA